MMGGRDVDMMGGRDVDRMGGRDVDITPLWEGVVGNTQL
jgi:hypothetical protein